MPASLSTSKEPDIVKAFNQYSGRSLVMKVISDAIYSFTVVRGGLLYELNPRSVPDDMYLELDLGRARKLVYRRTLGLLDLPFIKYRNITMADVGFAKTIFGG